MNDSDDEEREEDDGPVGSPDPSEPGDGPINLKWNPQPKRIGQIGDSEIQEVERGAVAVLSASGHVLNWLFAPYAHNPSARQAKRFLIQLRKIFHTRKSVAHIASQARTAAGRAKLLSCYNALWSTHNLVSMSLYAGLVREISQGSVRYESHRWMAGGINELGWLSTGDANLQAPRRRNAFLRYYANLLERVSIFVLPHHGAWTSFHIDVLAKLPNLAVAIAAAGKNSYGHPHKGVRTAVHDHSNAIFVHVKSSPRSAFILSADVNV